MDAGGKFYKAKLKKYGFYPLIIAAASDIKNTFI